MTGREWLGRRLARIIRPEPRQEVDEELAFHLEARAREYEARGLDPEAALRAAHERLGDLDGVAAECAELIADDRRRRARRQGLKVSLLDFKLGLRMLAKYPGLTVIGGLAMAFAIWVGAGTFEFVRQVVHPALPLDDGHEVVGILLLDAERGGVTSERRMAADFARWRGELDTIEQLGAFRTLDRNLITGEGVGEPVQVAEMTASGFDVARVAPLHGRTLVEADEAPGAPPVVVLGHDLWERRFAGDPGVVGTAVRLGGSQATVVGVMPEGFAFPIAESLWMPLRRGALEHEPRQGPRLFVFGRLARGASMKEAQAELATLGRRASADYPETHEHLRPRVLPYAESIYYLPNVAVLGLGSVNLVVVLLLVLICGNVALLLFARAATREGELLVRNALGASRARIVAQLFVEALVLGALAAVVGLGAAGFGLRWMYSTAVVELTGTSLPFWFSPSLSPATVAYAVLLTLLAAAVSGVLPALKVTRTGGTGLRQNTAGGGGPSFGGIWTAVIAAQVAITIAVPAMALMLRSGVRQIRDYDVGIAAERYLSARLEMDRAGAGEQETRDPGREAISGERGSDLPSGDARDPFIARFEAAARELEQRLESRPGVRGVTFGERLPGMYHPHRLVNIDEGGAAPIPPEWPAYRVSSVRVSVDYFTELGVPVVAGRDFHSGDLGSDTRTVIVNESFVDRVLGGRNPIGRHIQYVYFESEGFRDPETEPWYQIVGVVPDLGLSAGDYDPKVAGFYHPVAPGGAYPMHVAVNTVGDPGALTRDLRMLATAVDPGLRLYEPMPLDRVDEAELRFYLFWFWIVVLVGVVALLLSLAGIYAVMSFSVSRRTREIGVRVALGAGRGRVVAAIFRRPLAQLGLGLAVGCVLVVVLYSLAAGNTMTLRDQLFIAVYMLVMTMICLLACVVPTRRALAVEPMAALRSE